MRVGPAAQSCQLAASLFALMIASRIEHVPLVIRLSDVLVTVMVAA